MTNPPSVNVFSPAMQFSYSGVSGSTYSTKAPGQNTLVGNATSGWVETQPDGTAFRYLSTGVLSSIANKAGLRWTLTWDSGFNLVQAIKGPLGRTTSFTYNASSFITRIQDPGGRITSLTVDANSNLTRIISPELCTTSLIYDGSHNLLSWVSPLGDRTSFIYSSGTSFLKAVRQPMGRRTTFTSVTGSFVPINVFIDPRGGRTTMQFGQSTGAPTPYTSTDPFGSQTQVQARSDVLRATAGSQGRPRGADLVYLPVVGQWGLFHDRASGRRVTTPAPARASIPTSTTATTRSRRWSTSWVTARPWSGTAWATGSPWSIPTTSEPATSTTRWAASTAVQNALGQRATQLYDSQGRRSVDINPLGHRTSYAYDINSQRLRIQDPLGHITTTLHDNMNRLTVSDRRPWAIAPAIRMTRMDVWSRTKNPIGAITTRLYDLNSRLIATVDPWACGPAMDMTLRAI